MILLDTFFWKNCIYCISFSYDARVAPVVSIERHVGTMAIQTHALRLKILFPPYRPKTFEKYAQKKACYDASIK